MWAAEIQALTVSLRSPQLAKVVAELAGRPEPGPLVPLRPWRPELSQVLLSRKAVELLPDRSGETAQAVISGLLLWNDDLDASHELSQGLHTPTGSYLHGIMHRREPDYDNARYWLRQVGRHESLSPIASLAGRVPNSEPALIAGGAWNPIAMVAACQRAAGSPPGGDMTLRQLQTAELLGLLLTITGNSDR